MQRPEIIGQAANLVFERVHLCQRPPSRSSKRCALPRQTRVLAVELYEPRSSPRCRHTSSWCPDQTGGERSRARSWNPALASARAGGALSLARRGLSRCTQRMAAGNIARCNGDGRDRNNQRQTVDERRITNTIGKLTLPEIKYVERLLVAIGVLLSSRRRQRSPDRMPCTSNPLGR